MPKRPLEKAKKKAEHKYRSFRVSKPIKRTKDLPSAFRLWRDTLRFIAAHRWVFTKLTLLYALLYLMLARTPLTLDPGAIQEEAAGAGKEGGVNDFVLFGLTIGAKTTSVTDVVLLYRLILFVVVSLATIWLVRHLVGGEQVRVKEAFYRGMYPLVPYLLISLLMIVQFMPFAIAAALSSFLSAAGITTTGAENFILAILVFLFGLLSAYWLTVSSMALYAVTLPKMEPLQALRAVKEKVQHRRWYVFRRIAVLPLALFVVFGLVFYVIVALLPSFADIGFDVLAVAALPISHTYLYHLYRSLL